MRIQMILPLLLGLLAGRTAAQAEPFDPAASARTIAPFIDDQTVGVVRVDLSRVQIDALIDKLIELVPEARRQEAVARTAMKTAVETFRQAGGKEVYGVLSLADVPLGSAGRTGPFLIIPLREDATDQALRALFSGAFRDPAMERVGGVLFVGWRRTLERVKGMQPARRPELAQAFAAAGDTAVQALLLPTADNRRVIEELLPRLPEEIGGGSSRIVTRGLLWAAVGASGPPELSLRVVIQSENAQTASALRDKLATTYEWLGRQEDVRKHVPGFNRLARLLTPEVRGDRLTLVFDEKNQGIASLMAALKLSVQQARERARRAAAMNNLKQIGVAMYNYHDALKGFPAAASYDAQGKPLLSWRVHLLPFLKQQELYDQFHLDEPWDSEHNRKLIDQMPAVYRSPASKLKQKGRTSYLVPLGEGTVFYGRQVAAFEEIKDGTSHTIMVVEVDDDHAVIWSKPEDLPYDTKNPIKGLGGLYEDGFNALFCDGSVRFLNNTISPEALRALFTRAGGEATEPDDFRPR